MSEPQISITTFVNRFRLKSGATEDAFEAEFTRIGRYFSEQPGILGYTMSQSLHDPKEFVNVALWMDPESLQAAVNGPEFDPHVATLRDLAESDGTVYQERVRYLNDAIHSV